MSTWVESNYGHLHQMTRIAIIVILDDFLRLGGFRITNIRWSNPRDQCCICSCCSSDFIFCFCACYSFRRKKYRLIFAASFTHWIDRGCFSLIGSLTNLFLAKALACNWQACPCCDINVAVLEFVLHLINAVYCFSIFYFFLNCLVFVNAK